MSDLLPKILQLVLALGLLNVWLLRFNKPSSYRGGAARSLREEFSAYGLSDSVFYGVGFLKVGSALALIAGLWFSVLVVPAAAIVVALMIGAIVMHVRVKDPVIKSLPAIFMFGLSFIVVLTASKNF